MASAERLTWPMVNYWRRRLTCYRLTGFTFAPDRRSVAVAELAGQALERAGIDPAAVIRGEVTT